MLDRRTGIIREDDIGQTGGDQSQLLRAEYSFFAGRVDVDEGGSRSGPRAEYDEFLVFVVTKLGPPSDLGDQRSIHALVELFGSGARALGDMPK